ncbi:MAG TPA: hypothetical protein VHK67_00675 [Rhabdochlamydiaceae bacterium]|jgi:hypothetical protein|nr:hypothetical protein [Rhabdochlamydiaceae bacterium]
MMKKMMLITILGTALCAAEQVVSLYDLADENIEQFMQGKLQDVVVKCPAGMVLPLTFSLQGEFLGLESASQSSMKILKTCFVKCYGEKYLFSLDGKRWKEFSEFFTGKLHAEFHNTESGPLAYVGCELHQKQ